MFANYFLELAFSNYYNDYFVFLRQLFRIYDYNYSIQFFITSNIIVSLIISDFITAFDNLKGLL